MNKFRQILLVAVLLFAQLLAGAHAIEHAAGNEKGLPTHTCELCLSAHDLGSGLPVTCLLAPVDTVQLVPEITVANGRSEIPPPFPRQGAPPFS